MNDVLYLDNLISVFHLHVLLTFGPNINWLSRILKINEGRFTFNYFSKHSINQRIEFKRHYTNSKQSKFHKSFILDVTNATVSILSLWNTKELICMSPDKYVHSWLPLHGWIAERAFNTYLDRLAYEYSNIIHCLKQSIRFKLFYNYRYNEFPVLINKYVDAGLVFATSNHKGAVLCSAVSSFDKTFLMYIHNHTKV